VSGLAVLFGLVSAAFYGAADFFGGLATRRSSIFSVVVISQLVGFVLLLVATVFLPSHATASDYACGFAGGICGGVGLALLYHALSIGKMGVVSPITAVLAAALPVVLGVEARHETLAWFQSAGVVVALVAIVLISLSFDERGKMEFATAGVREAIAAGIVIGGFYLCLGLTHRDSGVQPILAARLASAALLVVVSLIARAQLRPARGVFPLIALAGVLDMTANVLYVLATRTGFLSIAAVLTSLYPASTVLLARFVLRERLHAIQKFGVVLALAGVALIAS
jgi:drug/metabolite transporter (DMT)-like permease